MSDLAPALALDTGLTTFPYVADNWDADFHGNQYVTKGWDSGFKGYEALLDVVMAERGRFFFSRGGVATFWARDRLQTNTTVVATYSGSDFVTAQYEFGARLFNDVRVAAYPRLADAGNSTVFDLDEPITIRPGKSRTLNCKYVNQDSEAKISVLDPYVLTFTSSGGEINYTIEYKARSASVTFTNVSTTIDGVVSVFTINGRRLTAYNKVELSAMDGVSRSLYGVRELRIDSKLMSDQGLAQNIADYELSRQSSARGEMLNVTRLILDDADCLDVLTRNVGDRISISDRQTGNAADYFIIGEKHQRSLQAGYRVTWYLELADMSQYWVIGESGFSELGETTYLGL